MRTFEIKRRESGRFYLFSLFGYNAAKQIQEWDLAMTVNESKTMLEELMVRTRPEELPLADRPALLNSISEKIAIPKKNYNPSQPPKSNHHFIPQAHDPTYAPITITIPGSINI